MAGTPFDRWQRAGAAVLAWLAIRQAAGQAKRSAEALRRERRRDHELDLLKELAEFMALDPGIGRGEREQ